MGKPIELGKSLYDSLTSFPGGINSGQNPLDLVPEVLAGSINTTIRGGNVTHRSCYHKRQVVTDGESTDNVLATGRYQGGCFYTDDNGSTSLVTLIDSRLFQWQISGYTITVREITISGGPAAAIQPQAWAWQAEKWVIVQDGVHNPIFFDGTTTAARSNYAVPPFVTTSAASDFTTNGIPAIGTSDTINFTSVAGLAVGYVVTFTGLGTFLVLSIVGVTVNLLNLDATPPGQTIVLVPVPQAISWFQTAGQQLPPGRMGDYGMMRNWFSLVDGRQFVASDIRGGASGTAANEFRDAVLYITENMFLRGGGNFAVPGTVGSITAMRFTANLDQSLGQGPLQVFTHNTVFSCNAPIDRQTWQTMNNPILTESLKVNGALGQNSTVIANSDVQFRSVDGVRSLILARREFATWGNTPISFEVSPVLSTDDLGLLPYGSAIVFDNRLLMTCGTFQDDDTGNVYFGGLVALNFDPQSSIRGKLPSVWDATVWTGMNVLQLIKGEVNQVERAFAFVLNLADGNKGIEVWEIKRSYNPTLTAQQQPLAAIYDNDGLHDIPVIWRFDSAGLKFGIPKDDHQYLALNNGEMWVSDVQGQLQFQTYYKADQYPCWANWTAWLTCQTAETTEARPGYRPRMGMGTPSNVGCDVSNNRPLNQGFTFQTRVVVQGHCVIEGLYFEAFTLPQPVFAAIDCAALCEFTL